MREQIQKEALREIGRVVYDYVYVDERREVVGGRRDAGISAEHQRGKEVAKSLTADGEGSGY